MLRLSLLWTAAALLLLAGLLALGVGILPSLSISGTIAMIGWLPL